VAAALEIFAERGFAGAKLDEIAKRAGVSKGTLYLYFETKEDIFRAVVTEAVAPNVASAQDSLFGLDLPFREIVRLFLSRFAELATTTPMGAVAKMVIGESRNFPELAKVWHDQVASRAIAMLAGLIERAQTRGEVRPGDPRYHAISLMGPMLLGVLWRETLTPVGGAAIDLSALARQHCETLLEGLCTRADAP
jgi:AcrR family transcriptional regulator